MRPLTPVLADAGRPGDALPAAACCSAACGLALRPCGLRALRLRRGRRTASRVGQARERGTAAGEKTSAAGEKESTRRTEERRQSASARTEQDTSFRILPSFLREAFFLLFLVGFGPCCLRLGLWLKAH